MSEIDNTRIKKIFYEKLEKEQTTMRKRTKIKASLLIAAILSMTSIGVLAANTNLFDRLFTNLGDISEYIQVADESVSSNGITMSLTGYLADNMGIVPQITFTRDDGSTFASDARVTGPSRGMGDTRQTGEWLRPDVSVNNISRFPLTRQMVSEDGLTLDVFPITHYDIEAVNSVELEIEVGRLLYNFEEERTTLYFDFYTAYRNADVKTIESEIHMCWNELLVIFDDAEIINYEAEIGTTIHSVAFARVYWTPAEALEGVDGIDLAGLQAGYNYIVAFNYTHRLEVGDREYHFWPDWPRTLINNNDYFSIETIRNIDGDISLDYLYRFLRVCSFENLKYMGGINFTVGSNNFIEGDWNIKTRFAANHESSEVELNKVFETGNPETTMTLTNINVSLFSTRLTYEIRDMNGNLVYDIPFYVFNEYYLGVVLQPMILGFADRMLIELPGASSWIDECGTINVSYNIEFNRESFTLMNTSDLVAVVIGDLGGNYERIYLHR